MGILHKEEKQSFYDELKCEWDMHPAGYLVIVGWGLCTPFSL